MSGPDFLDTNILVYAYDPLASKKQVIAREIIRNGIRSGSCISIQVLAEFAATLLHKVSPPVSPAQVRIALDALTALRVITPDAATVARAVDARTKYGVHFYDGMIIAAAEKAGCGRILSEDLNDTQAYFGAVAVNPFVGNRK